MKEWDPQRIKDQLDLELIGEEGKPAPSPQAIAAQKIREAVAYAADTVTHICLYSEHEGNRLKAADMIFAYAFGKASDKPIQVDGEVVDKIEQLIGTIQHDPSASN